MAPLECCTRVQENTDRRSTLLCSTRRRRAPGRLSLPDPALMISRTGTRRGRAVLLGGATLLICAMCYHVLRLTGADGRIIELPLDTDRGTAHHRDFSRDTTVTERGRRKEKTKKKKKKYVWSDDLESSSVTASKRRATRSSGRPTRALQYQPAPQAQCWLAQPANVEKYISKAWSGS